MGNQMGEFYSLVSDNLFFTVLCVCIFLILSVYYSHAKKRWAAVLQRSFSYHRYNLKMIKAEQGLDQRTSEVATAMLWALEKQLEIDTHAKTGLRAFFGAFSGKPSSLGIVADTSWTIMEHHVTMEKDIVRLHRTLTSSLYRYFLLNSILGVVLLFYMDFRLILSLLFKPGHGPSALYRNLFLEKQ